MVDFNICLGRLAVPRQARIAAKLDGELQRQGETALATLWCGMDEKDCDGSKGEGALVSRPPDWADLVAITLR